MTDVELIKSKIDIVAFISEYIQVKKAGRNFKALCPFHGEKTPSFVISPERGSWHCFGACAEGGDAVKFLQKWENIDFLEALKILAKKTGVTLSKFAPTDESKKKETYYEINHLASEFYHYLLTSHPAGKKALEYLKTRGIKKETVKTFSLGYAPNSWESLMRYLVKKGYQTSDIYTVGLIVRSGSGKFYDRFRGRLMFTLRDHRGNIIGFSGRLLDEEVYPERSRGAKYVNTSETPIYIKGNCLYGLDVTRDSIKKEKEAIVVEGEFDLLASFQVGVTNVVAIKGSALTEGQTLLLKRFTEQLILALDSDFAGNEAAKRGIEIAENAGLSVKVVKLSSGKDPADTISLNQALWKKELKEAVPIYDFVIENAIEKYKGEDALSKQKVSQEVIPFLSKIENPIIFSHYTKYLGRKLDVSEESIELAIRNFQKKQTVTSVQQFSPAKVMRDSMLEEYLLALIIQSSQPHVSLEKALKILTFSDFHEPALLNIIKLLFSYLKTHNKLEVKKFGQLLSPEIAPLFDKAYLYDIENVLSDENKYSHELSKTAKEIKKMSIRRSINELSTKIRQEEEKGGDNKILQEELRKLIEAKQEVDKSASKS